MIKTLIISISLISGLQRSCGQVNKSFNCSTCSHNDSAISKKLESMNFDNYKGKEVSLFLNDLPINYQEYIPDFGKPGYIWKIIFQYSDSLSVDIRVSDLNQNKPLNFGYSFSMDDFKRKKIEMICFRYAGKCIKGCEGDRLCR